MLLTLIVEEMKPTMYLFDSYSCINLQSIGRITAYLKHSVKQYKQSAVFLKEPIEKRWYLARFFTSLVSVTFFTKRERGDGGNSGLAIRTSPKNDKRTLILQKVIVF